MRPLAGLVALVLVSLAAFGNPAAAQGLSPEARAEIEAMRGEGLPKLMVHDEPRGPWEAEFVTPTGGYHDFTDFEGELTVVNIWATWCPPCRKEMPALDRLSGELEGDPVRVVAIASERGGMRKAPEFMESIGAGRLTPYADETMSLPRTVGALGLPTTIILDPQGREIARYQGDAEWDHPEAVALLRRLAELTGAGG
ncbi:MAG: TlpA family protein disulfide reductase [Pseudomonadota bacterium]